MIEITKEMNTKYGGLCLLNIVVQEDGLIQAYDANTGEPYMKIATIPHPKPGHAYIKNYSENKGVLGEMVRLGLCKPTGNIFLTGHTYMDEVLLTIPIDDGVDPDTNPI